LDRLAARRIGLWDVIGSASRKGSLDQAIRDAEHNQVDRLLHDFSDLRAIAFNGSAAASIGRRLVDSPSSGIALIDLPSSSAANTRKFEDKAASWIQLAEFLQP
jgi:hypoxanthine-DNA glycosylase